MPIRKTKPSTDRADKYAGNRVRERRIMIGLTQMWLAEATGVTYQQMHKYEHGINRISAGRLYEIARLLYVPITYFFEGFDGEAPLPTRPHQRMLLELARNFNEIKKDEHREAVTNLARVLAGQ